MLIDRAFVINLKIRPDRLRDFMARVPKVDGMPDVEVWPAVHGDLCHPPDIWTAGNGAWGCMRSHAALLEYCMNNRVSSYVVFEDDAQFATYYAQALPHVMASLPDDWQQFYLGGQLLHEHDHPPVKINDYIYRPYNVNRTHAFAVSTDGMVPIYKWINRLPYEPTFHIDHHLGRLHESQAINVYTPNQWLVGQGGSSSNVSGKTDPIEFWTNPEQLALGHWLYERPMCFVLRAPKWVADKFADRLHYGNWRDNHGFDRGLTQAAKYRYPGPEITKWFGHVRSECVREGKGRVPCLFHPQITDEMISFATIGRVVTIDCQDPEKVGDKIDEELASATA